MKSGVVVALAFSLALTTPPAFGQTSSESYAYDGQGRLTQVLRAGKEIDYQFDAADNITQVVKKLPLILTLTSDATMDCEDYVVYGDYMTGSFNIYISVTNAVGSYTVTWPAGFTALSSTSANEFMSPLDGSAQTITVSVTDSTGSIAQATVSGPPGCSWTYIY